MAPVLIDTTADFSPAVMPLATSPAGPRRSLLLAPPALAAHEDRLRAAFSAFDRATTDLQMLDRLSAGLVTLPAATYELVLVLADGSSGGPQRSELSRAAYALLVPAMATGGLLRFQDGPPRAADVREAILAGLVERGDGFEKLLQEETVIPLRFGKKKKTAAPPPPVRIDEDNAVKFDFSNFDDDIDDDIIDENDLLSEEDLKRRPVQPTECQPQKRRRPCKDCTCGLAAKFEAEDKQRRAAANAGLALRLDENDLNELDFTVEGKTGSCNNCSLGDAFRCSTCPYIGLPAFKPGEEVRILNDLVQL